LTRQTYSVTPNGSDTPHLDNARYWFIWITVRGVSKEC
jgi:hypothetical protein